MQKCTQVFRFSGLVDYLFQWFSGLPVSLVYWFIGFLVFWYVGFSDFLVYWFTGLLVFMIYWFTVTPFGLLVSTVCGFIGLLVSLVFWIIVYWFNGFHVFQLTGLMVRDFSQRDDGQLSLRNYHAGIQKELVGLPSSQIIIRLLITHTTT